MNLLSLSYAYLRARWLTNALLVVLLMLGVASISLLLHFSHQAEERLIRDARGFDLVVGAKGSPLQLILSSIYHLDIPTGNIPVEEASRLRRNPQVKQAIPVALGDNYQGFRIVGTEPAYIAHYNAELAEGKSFAEPMEAVVGARVAKESQLELNGTIIPSHGLSESGHEHADNLYKIVGVLKPTGTVIDRLILTPVESVWKVHGSEAHHHHDEKDESHEEHAEHEHHAHEAGEVEASDEITALLITYNNRAAAMSLPREINRTTSMQAASPAFETARLLSLLGMGLDTLRLFGIILIISAVAGMLVAVYQSLRERRYDLALMRVLGGSKTALMKQLMMETGLLLGAGILGGLTLSHIGMALLLAFSTQLKDIGFTPLAFLPEEVAIAAALLVAGLFVGLLPALSAYRIDVSRTLARG